MKLKQKQLDYSVKIDELSKLRLFQKLNSKTQDFIKKVGLNHRLTFQELRQVTEIATDLAMWEEKTFSYHWTKYEEKYLNTQGKIKKAILKDVIDHWRFLKANPSNYNPKPKKVKSIVRKVKSINNNNEVFGQCPVASDKTVCCNLYTIDAVQGCGLGCSYCSIQTFYEDGAIGIEDNLVDKLAKIKLDPKKNYHIGSGQSSDSLAMGNRNGILEAELQFAENNPNIILEFKTKTKNVDYFLSRELPKNVFVCWSLNPQTVIDHEEHFTASLDHRINAARQLADKGVLVGFHFHPIIYYEGWENDYTKIVHRLMNEFSPQEVGMISLGTLTFIKPAIKNLRLLGIPSKVLQIPLTDASGKFSYSFEIKQKIFGTVWNALKPWHNDVFIYFCMEEKELWESVIGSYYKTNEDFENALFKSVSQKMKLRS